MSVSHQLPGLIARRCETKAANHVVNSTLEAQKQIFAGDSLPPVRLLEIVGELILKNPIDAFHLLLFAQLDPVSNRLGAMIAAVLSWRKIALLDGAGIPEAAVSLEEELHAFPPAKPTFRFAVSSQFYVSFLISISSNLRLTIYDCDLKSRCFLNRQSSIVNITLGVSWADGIRCAGSA
jgi:hypothetical protein